jgi:hypothetical protein
MFIFFFFWGVSLLSGKEQGVFNFGALKKGACIYIFKTFLKGCW